MRFADWLALREPADARARSAALLDRVPLPAGATVVDLGSGTGSMARWVAARRPEVARWVLVDRDAALLDTARGLPGTVDRLVRDLDALTAADVDGAALVTASALLDVLTPADLDRVVAACAGRPALFTLTVSGSVTLTPADPLDAEVEAAFNAHQRRGSLLGPDAVDAAVAAFGGTVEVRDSPWRLGPAEAALTEEWFRGWLDAACEQVPSLAVAAAAYGPRRLAGIRAGDVEAVVHHRDLLAGG